MQQSQNSEHVLTLQGFVLGQYAMLWAMANPDKIDKLVVLNMPLGQKTKLRPELAAYKAKMAFMRPDPNVSKCNITALHSWHHSPFLWQLHVWHSLPWHHCNGRL